MARKGKKDKFVVDNSGKGSTAYGKSNDGTVEEAQTAALENAIADGAVSSISAAMTKALVSNDDVTAGVKEALKVRDVEDIIGGLGAVLTRTFKTFEAQAKERVRIAQQYGLDVTKIEEQNAKDRKKLLDDTIGARVGSLTDLLKNINFLLLLMAIVTLITATPWNATTAAAVTVRMARGGGSGPVTYVTNSFNLAGAVMTQDLLNQMNPIGVGSTIAAHSMTMTKLAQSASRRLA